MVEVGSPTSRLDEVEMWLTGFVDQPTNQLHMKRPMDSDNRAGAPCPQRGRTGGAGLWQLYWPPGQMVDLWATQGTQLA